MKGKKIAPFMIIKDISKEVKTDISEDISIDLNKEVKTDISKEVKTDISEDINKDISKEVKTDISQDISKDTNKDINRDSNRDISKDITDVQSGISNLTISSNKPTIFIVVGMAGSGKTTFCQRLYSWISSDKCEIDRVTGLNSNIYSVNLDPAVVNPKMPLNVDIKDHIDYYDVMEKYNLGPNGAITTSLNLFLLNIDKHLNPDAPFIIVDTPGQIKSFTWSSPGYILRDYFSKLGNVVMVYLVDSEVSQDPSVFMSNMIYSISLMCRYDIPVLCTFNKTDLQETSNIEAWIRDYEVFRGALDENKNSTPLLGSLALHFEEFYNEIDTVSVSSKTGYGKESFYKKVEELINKL